MLPSHRHAPRRLLAGSAIAVSLAAASLLAGAPVQAQEAQEHSAAPKQEQTRVIIMDRRDGPPPSVTERRGDRTETTIIRRERRDGPSSQSADRGERREFRIRRNNDGTLVTEGLDPELQRRIDGCRDGNNELANISEGSEGERTRVIVCTQGGAGPANVDVLQRARERLANNDDLSPETRQRVLAELDRAIAGARRD